MSLDDDTIGNETNLAKNLTKNLESHPTIQFIRLISDCQRSQRNITTREENKDRKIKKDHENENEKSFLLHINTIKFSGLLARTYSTLEFEQATTNKEPLRKKEKEKKIKKEKEKEKEKEIKKNQKLGKENHINFELKLPISENSLRFIVEYLSHRLDKLNRGQKEEEEISRCEPIETFGYIDWPDQDEVTWIDNIEKTFPQGTLKHLLRAANFMEITNLTHLISKWIAVKLRGCEIEIFKKRVLAL